MRQSPRIWLEEVKSPCRFDSNPRRKIRDCHLKAMHSTSALLRLVSPSTKHLTGHILETACVTLGQSGSLLTA